MTTQPSAHSSDAGWTRVSSMGAEGEVGLLHAAIVASATTPRNSGRRLLVVADMCRSRCEGATYLSAARPAVRYA